MKSLSRVWLFASPWTAAYQAPQSMEFSRQEYWSGLPFPSPKKIYRWQISTWKDVAYCTSSGKFKWKQQWATTTYLLEWPKTRNWQHQMLARMWSNRNFHSLLVKMQNDVVILKDSLEVSYKTKHTFTIPNNCTAWYLPKGVETYVYTQTCTHLFIAALFINAKILKQPRCLSIGEWIKKLWCIQIMKYYSVLKRKELSSHKRTW